MEDLPSEIFGFALGGTSRILYQLKNLDCRYLVLPNNLEHYLRMLRHDQPAFILGLGSYSGVDQDQIRIETVCTNRWRNGFLEGDALLERTINPFLLLGPGVKLAKGLGNSYCNQVSWQITSLIEQGELRSRYTFLHIPKRLDWRRAAQIIDQMLPV